MKHYIVTSKEDDYGNCRTELVETTEDCAKEYYSMKEVEESDVSTLRKYLRYIPSEEEFGRDDNERFYGAV